MRADKFKPANKREEAATLASTIMKEDKFYCFDKYARGDDGAKKEVNFQEFCAAVNDRYFYADGPEFLKERGRKGRDRGIERMTGFADASTKFSNLATVLNDMADPEKKVDITGLRAGFIAVRAIAAYAAERAGMEKTLIDPGEARKMADDINRSFDEEFPGGRSSKFKTTAEDEQANATQDYYLHKHFADGLGKIESQVEKIMDALSITVPKKGDFGPLKKQD